MVKKFFIMSMKIGSMLLLSIICMQCPVDNGSKDSAKAITVFSFASPSAAGIITEAGHTIAVTVPYGTVVTALVPTISQSGASINPASGAAQNFTSPVIYTVTAEDASTQEYMVTVTVALNSAKAITVFGFASPSVAGIITEASHTIAITVPYGTNVTALVPTISHSGASISPASGAARNFTSPVIYTVTAGDTSTQDYTVTVTVALSPAKAITVFSFASPSASGIITEASHTIAVTVPYGTNVTALVPTITQTGASISPASGAARNFTSPVIYTVTAADASTQDYTVTVTIALNQAKAITVFSFASPSASGIITEVSHTIAVTVPFETNVTALVPTITHSGASISPASGAARNFTSPVIYTVTAADASTQAYTVTVTVAADSSPSVTTTAIIGNLTFTVNIKGTSAIGGGNVTNQGGSAVIERGICWNTVGSPSKSDSYDADGSGTGIFTAASMTGLTVNTTYYVRAYATNSDSTAYGNEIMFNSGLTFGTDHTGGYVFYNNGSGGGLVSAKVDQQVSGWPDDSNWIYGGAGNSTQTTLNGNTSTAIGTGLANSNAIVAQPDHTKSAASNCLNYTDGTYSDWFLPSYDELNLVYVNLYLISVGALSDYYWSSSEYSNFRVWIHIFSSNTRSFTDKANINYYTRAVRAF